MAFLYCGEFVKTPTRIVETVLSFRSLQRWEQLENIFAVNF